MQLCYRGIRYESNPVVLTTVGTEAQGRFMGSPYTVRQSAVNLEIADKLGLVYRGICDTEEQKYRFLGRSYYRPRVFVATATA